MDNKTSQPIIRHFESLDSTNDEAKRYVLTWKKEQEDILKGTPLQKKEPSLPDTLIIAETQTRGRGRQGRHWYSPPGNVYMTLIKSIPVTVHKLPQLSLIVGLAVHRVLKNLISGDHHITVKWPNDILVDGQKISGVLIETDFQTDSPSASPICYIGIGLNRLSAPKTIAYPTCCLLDFIQDVPAIDILAANIMAELSLLLREWIEKGLDNIREEWLWSAYGLGKPVSAHVENGFMLYGRFVSLDAEGAILIEDEDHHVHTVRNPDIQYMV